MPADKDAHKIPAELLLRASFETIREGVVVLSSDLDIIMVNPVMEHWYKDSMPLVGKKCYQAFQGSDYPCEICPSLAALDRGTPASEELTFAPICGKMGWIQVYANPIRNKEGEIVGVVEFLHDVTAFREAQLSLQEREALFRTTLYSIGDAVITTDGDGRVQLMNKVAEELTGWHETEAAGRPLGQVFRIINEKTRKPVDNPATKVLRDGVVVGLANHTALISKSGREVPIADSGAPIFNDSGGISGAVLVFRNISEEHERQIENEAREQRAIRQRSALSLLSTNLHSLSGDLDCAAEMMIRVAAEAVQTARTSIWMLTEDENELVCLSLYENKTKEFSSGERLKVADYPGYFAAIRRESRVYVSNTYADPRTVEFTAKYLDPHGISSMLDAGIFVEGRLVGVFSFEHVGEEKIWHADDEAFASTMASVTAQVIYDLERQKAKAELQAGEEKYRTLVEQSMEMIYLHDMDGRIIEVNRAAIEWSGYSKEELAAMTVFDLDASTNDHELLVPMWHRWKIGMKPLAMDRLHRLKDDSIRIVEIRSAKILIGGEEMILALTRDVTEQRNSQKALAQQVEFEKMLSGITSAFIEAPLDRFGEAVEHALELSGKFFGADRSYICRFSEDLKYIYSVYEWCAGGIFSVHQRNQAFPASAVPWWTEKLQQNEIFFIPDVEALPPEAELDKQDFLIEKIKSLLTVSLTRAGTTIGYFGFDSVREKKQWSEDQLSFIKIVAEIIASALFKAETEVALSESEERYREILATMEEGYYEADLSGMVTYCNDAACRLFGYEPGELVGVSYDKLYREPDKAFQTFNRVFMTGEPEKGLILEMVRKDGSVRFGELSISLVRDKVGYISGFKGIGKDVTERIEYEKRLKYLSLHDQLTGIFNRNFFEVELSRLQTSREYPITIISADLDGLKLVNDTLGHDAGDRLLVSCSQVLQNSLRQSDILARVGGDEFSALLPGTDKSTGEKIVKRIRENVRRYNMQNEDLPLGVSIGIATADSRDIKLKNLFKRADDLMYRDKLYRSSSSRGKIVQSLLAALAERDYITEGHARRLEELCCIVGEKINLSSHQLSDLALLAQVHDLGKVGIPDHILFKPGPLNEEEWEIMREHPEKGYRIASSSPDLAGVADLILKHHERWDGSGYPLGLKGKKIPVECRILAVVDAFDAMTNHRPYNRAKTPEEAVEEIREHAGSQFDPELAKIFLTVLHESGILRG